MKKKILVLLVAVLAVVGVTGCGYVTNVIEKLTGISDDVCYYGCPNSKRVRRLNMKKKRIQLQ